AGLAGRSLGPGSRPGRARPRPGHNPVTDRAWSAGAVIGDVAGDGGAIEGQQAAVLDPAPDPDGGVAAGDGQPSHRSGHAVLLLVRPAPLPGWSRTDAPRREPALSPSRRRTRLRDRPYPALPGGLRTGCPRHFVAFSVWSGTRASFRIPSTDLEGGLSCGGYGALCAAAIRWSGKGWGG